MDWAHRRFCRAVWLVALASACVTHCLAAEGRDLGIAPPPYGEFVVIPLRVHVLSATDLPEIDCGLTDADIDRIVAKVNALVDPSVIEHLYEASQAGVKVDLIVRGACSLIPGVKGLSENIRVISVVDRFLEHSRIYYFADAKKMYLSSADWMPRNFFRRVEVVFPVYDPEIRRWVTDEMFASELQDNEAARLLHANGGYLPVPRANGAPPFSAQNYFVASAMQRIARQG